MPTLKANPFAQYEFEEVELLNAKILHPLQRCYIQTLLGEYSAQRLSITFDSNNPIQFAQQEAELTGQISILQLLLNDSDEAEAELRFRATNSAQDQTQA